MADRAEHTEPEKSEPEKSGLVDKVKAKLAELRRRWPLFDHVMRMVEHIGVVQGTMLAGAVTYFGYLSFFPVLVIAFVVVGYVAVAVPEARDQMETAIRSILPGLVGDKKSDAIQFEDISNAAGALGAIALVGLIYSGLGWISAMRGGLQGVFCVPKDKERNFVVAKLVDLVALAVIGVVLIVSVALSGAVTNLTEVVLSLMQLDEIPGASGVLQVVVALVGVALGVVASTLLFFTIFTLLTTSELPRGAVVKGAFLAALGFEVLKLLATTLIGLAADNPATAVLGTSLVLLVWINYFSRVVMFGAAWAYTSPEATALRDREAEAKRTRAELAERRRLRRQRYGARRRLEAQVPALKPAEQRRVDRLSVAAGVAVGASASALASVVRRRR